MVSRWSHQRPGEIVILDNRDSFVFNLAHRLYEAGARDLVVVRSDEVSAQEVRSWNPKALVISPGPGHPENAGCSIAAVELLSGAVPILGVCLGHQAIVAAFGGDVSRSNMPMHGRASWVEHDGTGVFEGLANPVSCGRYHSLVAQSPLPKTLRATAHTVQDRFVMGVEHVAHPTFGVQFHPESVLTEDGVQIFARFLKS